MWLLESSVHNAIQQAIKGGFAPSAEQVSRFESRLGEPKNSSGNNRILTVEGSTAVIDIKGVLTESPDFMALLFGGGNTTYSEIIQAIASAEQSPKIEDITLVVDSPGGAFDGLFGAIGAIQSTNKPIKALVHNLAASAAFAIVSQADEVVASNNSTRFGSVGVVATIGVNENEVEITSTHAPKKRPDVTTDVGKAMVVEEIDPMHDLFVDAIATGRGVSASKVNADFGQGATVLANEAVKRGMIDAIATDSPKSVRSTKKTTAISGNQPEANNMDLTQLQAQHPETFAAAVQQGITEERDRVTAHLIAGEMSGDVKTASDSIKNGADMTMTLQTQYMMSATNRGDIEGRVKDDLSADGGDTAHSNHSQESGDGSARTVMDILEAKLGLGE